MLRTVSRSCVVPGCGEEVSLSIGSPANQPVCAAHRMADSVSIPGGGCVRFCCGCRDLHPLDHFSGVSPTNNVCLAAKERFAEIGQRARARRNAIRHLRTLIPRDLTSQANDHRDEIDPSTEVWGSGFVAALAGKTFAFKAGFVVLYPAAAWLYGVQKAEALIPMTVICVGTLHVLAPFMHQQYYVKPLRDVRAAAANLGLTISSSFRFLDRSKHIDFQHRALRQSSLGWNRHGILLLLFLVISLLRGPQLSMLATALTSGMYFILRRKAVLSGWRCQQQWLDTAVFTICHFCVIDRYMSDDPDGSAFCQIFAKTGFILMMSLGCLRTALEASIVEIPLEGLVLWELPKTAVIVGLLTCGNWCGGSVMSPVMMCLSSATMLVFFMEYAAFRVSSEKRVMLEHIASLTQDEAAVSLPVPLDAAHCLQGRNEDRAYLHMLCKMAIATPAELSHEIRERILLAVKEEPESMQGVIRPGCVMLALTMRFSNWQELSSAMTSLVAHNDWGVTLLDGKPAGVHMNIQRSSYVVRNGALDLLPSRGVNMSIVSVGPVVVGPQVSTISLKVEGLGSAKHQLLLRTASSYLELEVEQEEREEDTVNITARVPASLPPAGLAWVDVMADVGDGSLVASNPFPIMFTPSRSVAEEMAESLQATPHLSENPNQLAGFLEDVSDCLHGQATASSTLLLAVIELGMAECCTRLATRQALKIANQSGQLFVGHRSQVQLP
ncbi:uncharacterized protein LOC142358023 [Convolutriloba macropyga]|uniref:uncharacterized protein LOC142358023 n=1 Tax=Convolutriloba macropyga TaxID=536237 RepID=UPI003F523050